METRDDYRTSARQNHWIPKRDHKFIGQEVFDDGVFLKPGENSKPTLNGKIAKHHLVLSRKCKF